MRIYLDNCCLNRPFDDQTQQRIYEEANAVVRIQARIASGILELAWSYVLDFEIESTPSPERRDRIQAWDVFAVKDVLASEEIIVFAESLITKGLRSKDALHVPCAVDAGADLFLTTDDRILNRAALVPEIRILNPIQLAATFTKP